MFFKNLPLVSKKESLKKTTESANCLKIKFTFTKSVFFNKLKTVKMKYKMIRIFVKIENSSFNLSD